jgi:hypothetical protein
MRVISQSGTIDLPYENFVIGKTASNEIVAMKTVADSPDNVMASVIAKYSTEEKALKAMKMLRQCYVGKVILENTDVSDDFYEQLEKLFNNGEPAIISVCTDGNQSKIEQFNSVFQFPADDEIEV